MKKKWAIFFTDMSKISFLFLVSLFCVGCDQATKFAAQRILEPNSVTKLLGDIIRIQLAQNDGSFLSLGTTLSSEWKFLIFVILVAIIIFILLIYYLYSPSMTYSSTIALSLIISGGFSNLIDRIRNNGIVVDFLNIGIGSLRTGVFNVADIAITSGIILIIISFFKKEIE